MEKFEGTVSVIIFASQNNTFCVFRLKTNKQTTPINVVANCPPPLLGQEISIEGEWVNHPRFGQQIKATKMKVLAPTDNEGIERFLSSSIDGIGPNMAKKIINKFGKETLDILNKTPEKLCEIEGIGKKTLNKIIKSYQEQGQLRDIIIWLENHGISGTYAGKILEKYGSFAIEIIEKNPFCLAQDIEGIGFLTADKIAFNLGINKNDNFRLKAGIDFSLMKIVSNGHCCIPENELLYKSANILGVNTTDLNEVFQGLKKEGLLCTEDVRGTTFVYPPYLYFAEKQTAQKILKLRRLDKIKTSIDFDEILKKWEQEQKIKLAKKQREAVLSIVDNGIFVMTGGPGTGKTTVIKAMLSLLEKAGLKVLLAAPTGRAAKRLSQATDKKAVTVHRLLGYNKADDEKMMSFDEQIEADAVIID